MWAFVGDNKPVEEEEEEEEEEEDGKEEDEEGSLEGTRRIKNAMEIVIVNFLRSGASHVP